MPRSLARLVPSMLLGAVALAAPLEAAANYIPSCSIAVHAPRPVVDVPDVVPSNAPVFSVFQLQSEVQRIRLLDGAGVEHPFTRVPFAAAPGGPIAFLVANPGLAEGAYTVEYTPGCQLPPASQVAASFRVGAPVALPKTAGTLTATARKSAAGDDAVELLVTHTLPEAHAAYVRHSRAWVDMDGTLQNFREFGSVEAGPNVYSVRFACDERDKRPSDEFGGTGLSPAGRHRFVATTLIAGAPAIEPATLDVDVDCAKNVVTLNGATTLPVEGRTAPEDASGDAGGCRMAGSTTAAPWATLGIALACLTLVRRRAIRGKA